MNHRKFLDKSLDAFGERLSEESRRQSCTGHIGNAHKVAVAEIEARQRLHRERVAAAIREGRLWPILREEFARDYSAFFDNLLLLELGVDEHFRAGHDDAKEKSKGS